MRLAATVMLVRDARPGTFEVFMLRRSARSAFAPDAIVFPGGTVDQGDYDVDQPSWPDERLAVEFRATIPSALTTSEAPVGVSDAHALVRAAIREVAEEASIALDPMHLVFFSHWITPPTEPRRYNTHFFVARAPHEQHGVADAFETHDARWLTPHDALAAHREGSLHLVYPTLKHLERLARFDDVASLLAFAQSKPILTIMPYCSPAEGFVMPAELEGAW